MPASLLTDEQISVRVAQRLTALGFDVASARDLHLLGMKDWELMAWAIQHRRAVVTENGPDFWREHCKCAKEGVNHPGVLVIGAWDPDEQFWALYHYLDGFPDGPSSNWYGPLHLAPTGFIQSKGGTVAPPRPALLPRHRP